MSTSCPRHRVRAVVRGRPGCHRTPSRTPHIGCEVAGGWHLLRRPRRPAPPAAPRRARAWHGRAAVSAAGRRPGRLVDLPGIARGTTSPAPGAARRALAEGVPPGRPGRLAADGRSGAGARPGRRVEVAARRERGRCPLARAGAPGRRSGDGGAPLPGIPVPAPPRRTGNLASPADHRGALHAHPLRCAARAGTPGLPRRREHLSRLDPVRARVPADPEPRHAFGPAPRRQRHTGPHPGIWRERNPKERGCSSRIPPVPRTGCTGGRSGSRPACPDWRAWSHSS